MYKMNVQENNAIMFFTWNVFVYKELLRWEMKLYGL